MFVFRHDVGVVCNQYINKLQYNKILVSSQKSFSTILERIDREYNNI